MRRQQNARLRRWGGWVLVGAVALITCWAGVKTLAELFAEPQGALAGQQRLAGGSKESGLAITGWVDQNRALQHTQLRSWYRLSNLSSSPLKDLQLHLQAPGFQLPQPPRGWAMAAFPVHLLERPNAVTSSSSLPEVGPGSSQTLWVDMVAIRRSGDSMVTAWFTWTGPRGELHGEALELGPVRLRSTWLEQTAAWKDFVIALAPLVIPILVLALGFYFQSRQQDLAQVRQAWATMLPISHKNNMKHYVPMISAIKTFEWRLSDLREKEDAEKLRSAFFYLLLSVKGMRTVDGYYLQDRQGEELIVRCLDLFVDALYAHFVPYESFSSMVDTIKPRDSVSTYTARLSAPQLNRSVLEAEGQFSTWVKTSYEEFKPLVLASILLDFEINRINAYWYGYQELFPLKKATPLLKELCGEQGALKDSAQEIYDYAVKSLSWRQRRELKHTLGLSRP